jgi:hypothetical protein
MKNKITETNWENVIDAEVDINVSLCFKFFFGCFRFRPKKYLP